MDVKVDVEYCGVCNFKGQCLELIKTIKEQIPEAEVSCTLGRRGSFEVKINDTLVHSKLASFALPEYQEVVENVQNAREGKEIKKVKEQPITECVLM